MNLSLREPSALFRLSVSGVVGVVVAALVQGRWELRLLSGWCALALTFLALAWRVILTADSDMTKRLATREDDGRAMSGLLTLTGSLGSLVAVVYVMAQVSDLQKAGHGGLATLLSVLSIATVVLSWLLIHTNYTFRYAHSYYDEQPEGGVQFDGTGAPDYLDFVYLAFTIGMTFQVSDTNISKRNIRRVLTWHALISYAYGTVLVALTINTVAGLMK
ncbi:DUF1345 domain-containing protein [Deinococcus sonorensis]|uniref:DUF1345 domain-containing protein n=2 Tax=Deinococcus sonorensis TaxID=309891 RepID=A0AAU7UCM1_9DEIO